MCSPTQLPTSVASGLISRLFLQRSFLSRRMKAHNGIALLALVLAGQLYGQSLDAVRVATGLTHVLYATAPPGDTHRLFLVRQIGQIHLKFRYSRPQLDSVSQHERARCDERRRGITRVGV